MTLTAVCFRVSGADHQRVIDALAEEGTALLGPAVVDGRPAIRACLASHRTTRDDIDLIVERLAAMSTCGWGAPRSPAR